MKLQQQYKKLLLLIFVLLVSACSGGGGGDEGEVIGTGAKTIVGTAAEGAPISQAPLAAKSRNGNKFNTTTNNDGKFSVLIDSSGSVLLKVNINNGKSLYSIAGDSGTTNIHPFTDLIIRNWFEVQGLDIDAEFASNDEFSNLPTPEEVNEIKAAIRSLIAQALVQFSVPNDFDLISTDFDANSQGFDLFLDLSLVVIINNNFTIALTDPDTNIVNEITSSVGLDTDLTQPDGIAPLIPGNLRAVPASATDIIVVWDPSSDNIGVAGYNIYRNSELVATTPYPVFTDSGLVTGTDYCYAVEAFDGAGNVSAQAMTPAPCPQTLGSLDNTPPAAPTTLSATPQGPNTISLSWLQTGINDVVGFKIYRGSVGDISQLVASTTSTAYSDFNLLGSSEYCYQILAYDAAGNESGRSEPEACATTEAGSTPPPTGASQVEFSASTYQATEVDGTATITVNRVGTVSEAISVDYSATNGTATAGVDFVTASGTLSWNANDTAAKTIYVQIKGDTSAEGAETVSLSLTNPSANTALGNNANATLTIANSDCAGVLSADVTVDTTITTCTVVTNSIAITNGATLTIAPGVTMLFQNNTGFNVNQDGALRAVGSVPSPILFTGTQLTPGYWRGVQFTFSNNVNNELDYVTIEYGGSGYNGSSNVVMFGGSGLPQRLKIRNTVLSDSIGYGFEFNDGSIVDAFENVAATRNASGPGILPSDLIGILNVNSDYTGNNVDRIDVRDGAVDTDQTWPAINVPYFMGSHNINANLIIAAGAQLIFGAGGDLNVRDTGSLRAEGTVGNKILFTADQPTRGYWQGIQYTFSNNVNNVLDHVIVEYGGGAGGNGAANLVMFGSNTLTNRIQITNSEFRESLEYGIELDTATIVTGFSNNVITNNQLSPVRVPADNVRFLDDTSSYTGNDDDTIFVENDDVDTDQTWLSLGVPYWVGSHNINGHLTVAPGNTLIFRGGGRFNVDEFGALTADGIAADSQIVFTAETQSPGFWNGIQFTFSNNVNNILNFVTVEYAGAPINGQGNVMLFGSSPSNASSATITNCTLQFSSSYGLWLDAASIINADYATSNTFSGNTSGDIFGP